MLALNLISYAKMVNNTYCNCAIDFEPCLNNIKNTKI